MTRAMESVLAEKLYDLYQCPGVVFTEQEICQLHTLSELSGKLDLLENMQHQPAINLEYEIEHLREAFIKVGNEAGFFNRAVPEGIAPLLDLLIPDKPLFDI